MGLPPNHPWMITTQTAAVMSALKVVKLSSDLDWRSWELAMQEVATLGGWADRIYVQGYRASDDLNKAAYMFLRSACSPQVKELIVAVPNAFDAYTVLRNALGPESAAAKARLATQ
ncbi:hypothetical protein JCM9279_001673 [Rhodotorula babjevae]